MTMLARQLAAQSSNREQPLPAIRDGPHWTGGTLKDIFYAVDGLSLRIHHHLYWIVPLLVVAIIALVYWALSSSDDYRGPQL